MSKFASLDINSWVLVSFGATSMSPEKWQIGQVQSLHDKFGSNRTMIFDYGHSHIAADHTHIGAAMREPSVCYVMPEQIIAVFEKRDGAEGARERAYRVRQLKQADLDRALAAHQEARKACAEAVLDAAITETGR